MSKRHGSPFSMYRHIITGDDEIATGLRQVVLNLYDPLNPLHLPALFDKADSWQRSVIIELLTSHKKRGLNDPAFISIVKEILTLKERGEVL